jgi:uncharacterized iron-regulated membrane protein
MNLLHRIVHRPRTIAAREWLFQIHLYAGLIAGLYALLIGVTGSALVFAPQMRDWLDRDLTRVEGSGPHISADQALTAVRSAHPDFQAMSIRIPVDPRDTFRISASHMGGHEYFVNPFNAALVGEGDEKRDLLAWVQQLHFNLLGGATGRVVNGVGALMLLLLSGTGLAIWWPGKALVRRALSVKWKARWPRANYDLHSAVGFFTLAFTVLLSLTGAYYAWPKESQKLVGYFSPLRQKALPPRLRRHAAGQDLPVGQLMDIAHHAVPGAWVSIVMLSHGPGDPVKITLMNGGAREYQNSNYVYLDPRTGRIVRVDDVRTRSAGDALMAWIGPLHFGTFGGGTAVYILWLVLGLSPAVLGVSGMLMWWNRVAVKKLRNWRSGVKREPARRTICSPEQVSRSA